MRIAEKHDSARGPVPAATASQSGALSGDALRRRPREHESRRRRQLVEATLCVRVQKERRSRLKR